MKAPAGEDRVLGFAIMNHSQIPDAGLSAGWFQSKKNREIFKLISTNGWAGDTVELCERLKGKIPAGYISEITTGIPTSANLIYHVIEEEKNRLAKRILDELHNYGGAGSVDLKRVKPLLQEALRLEERETKGISPLITNLGDAEPRPAEWLWYNRIPLGKVSMLFGDPGLAVDYRLV